VGAGGSTSWSRLICLHHSQAIQVSLLEARRLIQLRRLQTRPSQVRVIRQTSREGDPEGGRMSTSCTTMVDVLQLRSILKRVRQSSSFHRNTPRAAPVRRRRMAHRMKLTEMSLAQHLRRCKSDNLHEWCYPLDPPAVSLYIVSCSGCMYSLSHWLLLRDLIDWTDFLSTFLLLSHYCSSQTLIMGHHSPLLNDMYTPGVEEPFPPTRPFCGSLLCFSTVQVFTVALSCVAMTVACWKKILNM